MDTAALRDRYDTDALRTVGSTVVSYGLILLGMFVLLFVIPYLIFAVLL